MQHCRGRWAQAVCVDTLLCFGAEVSRSQRHSPLAGGLCLLVRAGTHIQRSARKAVHRVGVTLLGEQPLHSRKLAFSSCKVPAHGTALSADAGVLHAAGSILSTLHEALMIIFCARSCATVLPKRRDTARNQPLSCLSLDGFSKALQVSCLVCDLWMSFENLQWRPLVVVAASRVGNLRTTIWL